MYDHKIDDILLCDFGCSEFFHPTSDTLSNTTKGTYLFMAPEMMDCSLELPSMVEECTKELPDHILKECFSNILITGM